MIPFLSLLLLAPVLGFAASEELDVHIAVKETGTEPPPTPMGVHLLGMAGFSVASEKDASVQGSDYGLGLQVAFPQGGGFGWVAGVHFRNGFLHERVMPFVGYESFDINLNLKKILLEVGVEQFISPQFSVQGSVAWGVGAFNQSAASVQITTLNPASGLSTIQLVDVNVASYNEVVVLGRGIYQLTPGFGLGLETAYRSAGYDLSVEWRRGVPLVGLELAGVLVARF